MDCLISKTTSALCWRKLKQNLHFLKKRATVYDLTTHHCLLDVNFLSTGQAEVCYLRHQAVPYKDVPGCQIPVDELVPREWRRGGALLLVTTHGLNTETS